MDDPHPGNQAALGMILKGYPRISETFISNEIYLLEQLGFDIRIFPMRKPRESFTHESVKRIKAPVHYLPTELLPSLAVLLWHNIQVFFKRPRLYGAACRLALRRLRRSKKIATLKHLLQAGYLTNTCLLPQPEIRHLHAHFAHSPTSVTLFASLMSGLPFSFTGHAKDIYTSDAEQLREKINLARFVVTCTNYNKNYLGSIAGAHSTTPIHCVYHGIDLELFSGEKPHQKTPGPPYRLLTVARITGKKGLDTVYRALALLKDEGMDFEHTLVGDGDEREAILNLKSGLGLDRQCRWLGTQTHEQVLELFRRADLFVLGCRVTENGDRDGIPNVLVESLAMNVPAVATNVSAIPELLENERTGLTVSPDSPQALADAMKKLLADKILREALIESGKQMVAENFNNKRLVRRLAEIYQEEAGIHPAGANT